MCSVLLGRSALNRDCSRMYSPRWPNRREVVVRPHWSSPMVGQWVQKLKSWPLCNFSTFQSGKILQSWPLCNFSTFQCAHVRARAKIQITSNVQYTSDANIRPPAGALTVVQCTAVRLFSGRGGVIPLGKFRFLSPHRGVQGFGGMAFL